MKKLISLLLILLILVGCSSGGKLQKTSNNKILSQMDKVNFDSISIYYEDYSVFTFLFSDAKNFDEAINAIKDINVSKKEVSNEGEPLYVDLYSEDGFVTLVLYENSVEVRDEELNETVYYSDNLSSIKDKLIACVEENNKNDHYTSDGELVFEYEDLKGYLIGQDVNADGSHTVDIQFVNEGDKGYEVALNSIVNGIYTHTYQSYMCFPGDSISYTIFVNDSIYQSFTNEDPTSIYYFFDVYGLDTESYKILDYLYTSDPVMLFDGEVKTMPSLNPVYEDESIKLHCNLQDDEMIVLTNLYVENKLNEDIKVKIVSFELNGEVIDGEYSLLANTLPVKALSGLFSLYPIYTYNYDVEKDEITYFTADSIKLNLEIVNGDEVRTSKITLR